MQMKNKTKKLFSMLLCIVLIVAMALFTTGCGEKSTTDSTPSNVQTSTEDVIVKGEGRTVFDFSVVDKEGKEIYFEIHTDETTVGGALLACQLIEGEEGQYGLYVKVVNGITADYDVDGTYWAFYVNGQYAMSGVDTTDINTSDYYTFKVEK